MKPRRSILSVPGHIEKMHAKACQSKVDVVILDLEDSVPLDDKESIAKALTVCYFHWTVRKKTTGSPIKGDPVVFRSV